MGLAALVIINSSFLDDFLLLILSKFGDFQAFILNLGNGGFTCQLGAKRVISCAHLPIAPRLQGAFLSGM